MARTLSYGRASCLSSLSEEDPVLYFWGLSVFEVHGDLHIFQIVNLLSISQLYLDSLSKLLH
jgi:hypothetical protein